MRRITFILSLVIAFVSLSSFTGITKKVNYLSTANDLYVQNNTDKVLSNISFTSSLDMVTFTNVPGAGGNQSGSVHHDPADDITIAFFFSNVPAGAVARIYNIDPAVPDGVVNVHAGLNVFQLKGPIAPGAIRVYIDPK